VLGLEAGVGVFGWWGDNGVGGGGDTMWNGVDVKAGSVERIWNEGVRNVWCVFALVCLEGICGGLA